MADYNIFKGAKDFLKKLFNINSETEIPEAAIEEAEKILTEIFEQFLADVEEVESNSPLLETTLSTKRSKTSVGGKSVPKVELTVDGEFYNILNKGVNTTIKASDYVVTASESPRNGEQLKAFPILVRQRAGTIPNTLDIVTRESKDGKAAKYASDGLPNREVGDPVVFRRQVTLNIKPRNFTKTIAELAQEELNRRGIKGIEIEAIDG